MDKDDPECNLINGTRHDLSIVSFGTVNFVQMISPTLKAFVYLWEYESNELFYIFVRKVKYFWRFLLFLRRVPGTETDSSVSVSKSEELHNVAITGKVTARNSLTWCHSTLLCADN